MNPVIYLDELDKCSATPKGDEVVNALLHITDTSQNSNFRDRYFSGVDLDVSRCLFVFAFNDPSKISPVLLDRLQIVQTDAFETRDQIKILKDYLLPRVLSERGLSADFLGLSGDALHEAAAACSLGGVRVLRSVLEQVVCKLSIYGETGDIDMAYPLKKQDFTQTSPGCYRLESGLSRMLSDAVSSLEQPPPASMYS
jgi:ATP-dependent Lon protease